MMKSLRHLNYGLVILKATNTDSEILLFQINVSTRTEPFERFVIEVKTKSVKFI